MAKKKKQDKETTIVDYYDLKVDKIDELVDALKNDTPAEDVQPISTKISDCTGIDSPEFKTKRGKDKEFNPYKIDKFARIPVWIKALFIKFWFFGAVCYFVNMGLGSLFKDASNSQWLDIILLDGVITGIIVDCLVNPIFRMLESDEKEYNYYMMFPFPLKAFWTFFANIIYYTLLFFGPVNYLHLGLNELVQLIFGSKAHVAVEPLLFGIETLICDMALIGLKDLGVFAVKKIIAKKRAAKASEEAEINRVFEEQQVEKESLPVEEKSAEASALDRVTAEVLENKGGENNSVKERGE